jgi:hypothetical protein
MYSQAEPQIVVYRQVENVRPLKNHPYFPAQAYKVRGGIEDIPPFDNYLSLDFYLLDEVVHPVEASQQRRFAAARRAYYCGDIAMGDGYVYVLQGQKLPVIQVQIVRLYFCLEVHIYLPVADYPNLPVM